MNYKFLTLLVSSVSLIHGLQAADQDDLDLNEAIRLSLQEQQAQAKPGPIQDLPPYVDDDEYAGPEVGDKDLQAAINASYRENLIRDDAGFQIAGILHMPVPQQVEPVVRHNGAQNGGDPDMECVLAESKREFEEKQRKQAQEEMKLIAQSKIEQAIQIFGNRRRAIDALHEQFEIAKSGDMDERKRDKYRSKLKIIYLQNSLPEEEDVLRELETLDKSFYEALDSDMFATLEHFEEYFEEYLANRLQTHLACANGNPHIVALIKNEEAWEAHLIRLDVREDIQKIKAREEAAKKKASDELTKIGEARETYRQAATAALGEYLKKSASPDYETFKSFLVTKKLPVTEYEDILHDAWDLKDALLMSIQAQEASEKREAQEKEREALAKKEELDRQRRAGRELFLARVEKEQAEAKQRAAAVEHAQKLAAEEAQRKAREEAEAVAAKEQFARRIREKYEADLKAKIAELRLAAQNEVKK